MAATKFEGTVKEVALNVRQFLDLANPDAQVRVLINLQEVVATDQETQAAIKVLSDSILKGYETAEPLVLEELALPPPPESSDPVFFDPKNNVWMFWDESWSIAHGPFSTEADARSALMQYALTELEGLNAANAERVALEATQREADKRDQYLRDLEAEADELDKAGNEDRFLAEGVDEYDMD